MWSHFYLYICICVIVSFPVLVVSDSILSMYKSRHTHTHTSELCLLRTLLICHPSSPQGDFCLGAAVSVLPPVSDCLSDPVCSARCVFLMNVLLQVQLRSRVFVWDESCSRGDSRLCCGFVSTLNGLGSEDVCVWDSNRSVCVAFCYSMAFCAIIFKLKTNGFCFLAVVVQF